MALAQRNEALLWMIEWQGIVKKSPALPPFMSENPEVLQSILVIQTQHVVLAILRRRRDFLRSICIHTILLEHRIIDVVRLEYHGQSLRRSTLEFIADLNIDNLFALDIG